MHQSGACTKVQAPVVFAREMAMRTDDSEKIAGNTKSGAVLL